MNDNLSNIHLQRRLSSKDTEELENYKTYLSLLERSSSVLLESSQDESICEVLQQIGQATSARFVLLYLTPELIDPQYARQQFFWPTQDSQSAQSFLLGLKDLSFNHYSELSDALRVGMIVNKPIQELAPPEKGALSWEKLHDLLAIPLLTEGELTGFVFILRELPVLPWHSIAIRILSAVMNDLALSLAKRRMERDLLAHQKRLKTLVGATDDMLFEVNSDAKIVNIWSTHPAMPVRDLRGLSIERAFPAEMAKIFLSTLPKALLENTSKTIQFSIPSLNGPIYFVARLQSVPAESGQGNNMIALMRDVSSIVQEESQRKTMLDTLNMLEEAIIDLSIDGTLLQTSIGWANLRSIPENKIAIDIGEPLCTFVLLEDQEKFLITLHHLFSGVLTSSSTRFRLIRSQLEPLWVEAKLIAHFNPNGEIGSFRGILRDITSTHLHESRITQLALYDNLTRLPNRILLDDHLQNALVRAEKNNLKIALGFIDLDHFKQINDTFGHKVGDEVLVNLSSQLKSVLRDNDTLARWGGDEFVVLLPDLHNLAPLRNIAERLREIARQGIVLEDLQTKPTISIGFAIYPDDAKTADALLSAADHTMFYAKGAGRNNVQFYGDLMHSTEVEREHIVIQTRLNSIIQADGIQVFYQPIVDPFSNKVVSVEALARWHDDKMGWISPEIFVPMAEKLGIIRELSEQVIEHALKDLSAWRKLGLMQKIAVNVSRIQLFAHGFQANLIALLNKYQLKPQDIILEITESVALTDMSRQSKHLLNLSNAGFSIAIDDFGTGYSSLSQLHDMPAHLIKVDVSFTSRLTTKPGQRIMQAIVQMAQALELDVVVEGVEDKFSRDFLKKLGVKKQQGYYFSKPVSANVCEWLMQQGMS